MLIFSLSVKFRAELQRAVDDVREENLFVKSTLRACFLRAVYLTQGDLGPSGAPGQKGNRGRRGSRGEPVRIVREPVTPSSWCHGDDESYKITAVLEPSSAHL